MRDWSALAARYPERFVQDPETGAYYPTIEGGEPTTIAIITVAVAVAGVAMQAYAMSEQQAAANQQARAQAESARIQADAERAREQAIYDQQVEQQRLDREAAEREGQAYDLNVKIAEENAAAARASAGIERETLRERQRRTLARQRAGYGATGVVSAEGSPLLVMMESHDQASRELAALDLAAQGQVSAFEQQAALDRITASNVRLRRSSEPRLLPPVDRGTRVITGNPYLAAGGTLLTGAGNIGFRSYDIWGRTPPIPKAGAPSSLGYYGVTG